METATETPAPASVRDRLKALKDEAGGRHTTTLPVSKIAVTYPAFMTHAQVIAAQKMAGKDRGRVGPVLVAQTCLFEGERLTVDEITGGLLHNLDTVHLVNLLLAGDGAGGEDDTGN